MAGQGRELFIQGAHLTALHHFMADLYVIQFLRAPDPEAAFADWKRRTKHGLGNVTLPELDPAMSDAMTGEISDQAQRFVQTVEARLKIQLGAKPKQTR